jgi:hypothetical protein
LGSYGCVERGLNAIFRRKMWISLFSGGPLKKIFEEINAMKRPVYGTFLPATINSSFYYTPIMGLRVLALCFNLGFSKK